MKYALSGTVTLALHHDVPFIPLHCLHFHTKIYPSSTNFSSLYFTSCNINALRFASLHILWFPPHYHLALFITFLTLSLILLRLQERPPKASSGNWFQSCMVLFTKEYFLTCLLFSDPNSHIMINSAQIAWLFQSITYGLPCPFSHVNFEECTYVCYLGALCQGACEHPFTAMISTNNWTSYCTNSVQYTCTPPISLRMILTPSSHNLPSFLNRCKQPEVYLSHH
jgi:hypothetical protein